MSFIVRAYWYLKAEIANARDHLIFLINDVRNPDADIDPGTPLPDPSTTLKAKTSGSYADRVRKS